MGHLILVNHFVLLHLFNGDNLPTFLVAANTYLSKCPSSDDFQRFKISDCNARSTNKFLWVKQLWIVYLRHSVKLRLFVLDFLLYKLFFLLAQIHLVHLDHQFVPCLFFFDFFCLLLGVFRLDVRFDSLSTLASAICGLYLRPDWHCLLGRGLLKMLARCVWVFLSAKNTSFVIWEVMLTGSWRYFMQK